MFALLMLALMLIIIIIVVASSIAYKQDISTRSILRVALLLSATCTFGGLAYGAFVAEPMAFGFVTDTDTTGTVVVYGIMGVIAGAGVGFIWVVVSSIAAGLLRLRK